MRGTFNKDAFYERCEMNLHGWGVDLSFSQRGRECHRHLPYPSSKVICSFVCIGKETTLILLGTLKPIDYCGETFTNSTIV